MIEGLNMETSALTSARPQTAPTDTVEIEGVGTVTVRGLSRFEYVMTTQGDDQLKNERRLLHFAMVDPPMSEADVAAWQRVPGTTMEINRVLMKVNELSGITQGAAKSEVPGTGSES